jgi:Pathogen effector
VPNNHHSTPTPQPASIDFNQIYTVFEMPSLTLRVLAQAIIGLAATALALPHASTVGHPSDLVAREVQLRDGSFATIHENRNLAFTTRGPSGTTEPSSPLDKRFNYTNPGYPDYCGEATAIETFGDSAPLASDCETIAQTYAFPVSGFWTILPEDFAAAPGGQVTIASSGTCKFAVRSLNDPVIFAHFGTNDLHFYIQSCVGDAQNGRIQALSDIACSNGVTASVGLEWKMSHV